jgi:hypothetical protein
LDCIQLSTSWKEINHILSFLSFNHQYSMQQSPSWEASSYSASQEIPHLLWNPKAYYHVHMSQTGWQNSYFWTIKKVVSGLRWQALALTKEQQH